MSKQEFKFLLITWSTWLCMLFIVAFGAASLFPYEPSFPYARELLKPSGLPQWLYSWAGFDGVHYLTIARQGYKGTGLIQAFFPLFPLVVRAIDMVLPLVISGIITGIAMSLALVITWYIFIKHFFTAQFAKASLIVLLLFPTSFFFAAVYTESLFLTLCLLSFYFVDTRRWKLALLVTILATATRVTGVFLVPSLVLAVILKDPSWKELFPQFKTKKAFSWLRKQFKSYGPQVGLLILGYGGLWIYMAYLSREFKDPFYFYHVQSEFGSGREERIILWPQVVWRYIKIFLTQSRFTWFTWSIFQEAVVGVLGLFTLLLSFKWVKPAWVFYALGAFILPTLTGTFSSMPRYILLCFPLFIVLTYVVQNNARWRWLYFLVSGMLLVINTMLFIQGYWVA